MSKPTNIQRCVVDGDVIAYRAAYSTQDEDAWATQDVVDSLMDYIIGETVIFEDETNFGVYLTGKGNFRYDIAKSEPYKGNRKSEKPAHLPVARDYLVSKWGAVVVNGKEADDAIATEVQWYDPEAFVIVSVDKDFLTVPCWMYNFVTDTWVYSTKESARKFFYTQVLTGDRVDNIIGIHGVGPKKAEKILEGCKTEEELWDACVKAYVKAEYDKSGQGEYVDVVKVTERVVENARLLWLQRKENEIWQPPT